MRLSILSGLLAVSLVSAASWGFDDATIQVQEKGSEAGTKQKFTAEKGISQAISLKASGFLRFAVTITNGGKPRQPHQAFITISNADKQLEESFPLEIKSNGKAKLDLKHADIPIALLSSSKPLQASIVIGSFGSSKPLKSKIFTLNAASDAKAATPAAVPRYSSLPEIKHIFRDDPRSPAKILTLVFTIAVIACLPILLGTWAGLGANLKHLPQAFQTSPISHSLFFTSIVAMEFVFWQYYASWRLFTVLPVAGVVGLVAFLSGSGALTEVQERRLKGAR